MPSACWWISSPPRCGGWRACRRRRRSRRAPRSSRSGPGNVLSGLLKRIVPGAADGHARDGGRGGEIPRMMTHAHDPIDLTGKAAFVTGSTRGIGLAIARALHAAGAKVAVVGRDAGAGRRRSPPSSASARPAFACDVARGDQVEAAIAAAEAALGPDRHPGQQRRPHARQHPAPAHRRRLGRRARRQPQGRVPHHAGGHQGHDEAAVRAAS